MRKTKMLNKELIIDAVNASNIISDTLNNLIPLITAKLDGQFIGATTHRASIKIDKEIKALLADSVPQGIRCVVIYERGGVYIRVSTIVSRPRPGDTDLSHRIVTDRLLCNIDPTTRIASVQNMPVFESYPKTLTANVLIGFDNLSDAEDQVEYRRSIVDVQKRQLKHFIKHPGA